MQLIEDYRPLLIFVTPEKITEGAMAKADIAFRRVFSRGERYVLLSLPHPSGPTPAANERKIIADWTNKPHVVEGSKKCCVTSATVVSSALGRGALTAILWIWKPPIPLEVFGDAETALDHCLTRAKMENLPIGSDVRAKVIARLTAMGSIRGRTDGPNPGL